MFYIGGCAWDTWVLMAPPCLFQAGFSTSSITLVLVSFQTLLHLAWLLHPGPEGPALIFHSLSSWDNSFPCFYLFNLNPG